jgi:hypothetical protein
VKVSIDIIFFKTGDNMKKTFDEWDYIILDTPVRCGSTYILNILLGLFGIDDRIYSELDFTRECKVWKTHKLHLNFYSKGASIRKNVLHITIFRKYEIARIKKEVEGRINFYKNNPDNSIILYYNDFKDNSAEDELKYINYVYDAIKPYVDFEPNFENALMRMKLVRAVTEALSPFPFKIGDNYTGIHGCHRDRFNNIKRCKTEWPNIAPSCKPKVNPNI